MVHRAGAAAQVQHGGQCAGDIGLCALDRSVEVIAFARLDAMALDNVQPVPWVLGLSMRLPRNHLPAAAPQQVVGIVDLVAALAEHRTAVFFR